MRILPAVAFGIVLSASLSGAEDETRARRAFEAIVPSQVQALERSTKWLLKSQNQDGSWGVDFHTPADVSATSCAALSLLAQGNTGHDGPDPEGVRAVKRALTYILKRVQRMRPNADIAEGETSDIQTYVGARVHSVFALLFLSQVYGCDAIEPSDRVEIKEAIGKLCDTVAGGQEADGSWYKETYSSLQATAWAFCALRSVTDAGIPIKHASIDKALKFIRTQLDPNANMFVTRVNGRNQGNQIYATASGLRIVYGVGLWKNREYSKVADTLLGQITNVNTGFLTDTGEDFMASVLLTHALIKNEGPTWERWFGFARNRLTKIQNADGSWTATSCLAGRTFPTAFAMLVMETPYRLLPVQEL
jgi:hypothetical protein